jgi:hypothetical protein
MSDRRSDDRRGKDRRGEAGVTLIELMIGVMLLGIIIVPLTGAIVTGLINTGEATTRLSESRSSLFTSAFFADDVQSSDQDLIVVGGTPSWQCGSGTNVVSFGWSESTTPRTPTDPPAVRASYALETSGGDTVLRRHFCNGSSQTSAKVGPALASDPPTVTCADGAVLVSCETGGSLIRTVQLVADTPNHENYFTLIGARRAT